MIMIIDILIDISASMSEDQRIASLLLCTGIALAFSKYGTKIRISVFAERDNVWILTEDFSFNDIEIQLSRLRDALSLKKRFYSFPADALKKLKNSRIPIRVFINQTAPRQYSSKIGASSACTDFLTFGISPCCVS